MSNLVIDTTKKRPYKKVFAPTDLSSKISSKTDFIKFFSESLQL